MFWWAVLRLERADVRPDKIDLRPERVGFWHKRVDFRLKGGDNQSLKGNMWLAIPATLLCMIVHWRESNAAAPKGTKSCKT